LIYKNKKIKIAENGVNMKMQKILKEQSVTDLISVKV